MKSKRILKKTVKWNRRLQFHVSEYHIPLNRPHSFYGNETWIMRRNKGKGHGHATQIPTAFYICNKREAGEKETFCTIYFTIRIVRVHENESHVVRSKLLFDFYGHRKWITYGIHNITQHNTIHQRRSEQIYWTCLQCYTLSFHFEWVLCCFVQIDFCYSTLSQATNYSILWIPSYNS